MFRGVKSATLPVLLCGVCAVSAAQAQDFEQQRVEDRIIKLEKQINLLERAFFKKQELSGSAASADGEDGAVESRISTLETTMRDLRGKIEELEHENFLLKAKIARAPGNAGNITLGAANVGNSETVSSEIVTVYENPDAAELPEKQRPVKTSAVATPVTKPPVPASMSGRKNVFQKPAEIVKKGSGIAAAADNNAKSGAKPGVPTEKATVSETIVTEYSDYSGPINLGNAEPAAGNTDNVTTAGSSKPESAKEQYDWALSLITEAKYSDAALAFHQFVNDHPNTEMTGNAYYWLAETYYVRGDFEQASVYFLEGYKKFPESSKAADNLLKLAISLGNTGKKKEACISFDKLSNEFPSASSAIKNRSKKESARLECSG